jgi:hypothetical protein
MSDTKELREKYMKGPPIGYTKREIEKMSDNDLLDMDYFLNEIED